MTGAMFHQLKWGVRVPTFMRSPKFYDNGSVLAECLQTAAEEIAKKTIRVHVAEQGKGGAGARSRA